MIGRVVVAKRREGNQERHPGRLGNPAILNTLGAALYRASKYDSAIVRLKESIRAAGGEGTPLDWLFLALAKARTGASDEAKLWHARAAARWRQVNQQKSGRLNGLPPLSWTDRLERQLLLREAEAATTRP